MLVLQRRLPGESGRWRSVVVFDARSTQRVYDAVAMLASACITPVLWRLVRGDDEQQAVSVYENGRWVLAQQADSPWWDSPHHRDSEWLAGDFEPTIPMGLR